MLRKYAASMVAIAVAACAGSSWADSPAAAPAPPTRQAIYNDAQSAYDAGDWQAAITGFNQVLAGAKSTSRSTGVIRGRLARALLRRGRIDEAQATAAQALVEIRQGETGPDADLAEAYLTLGDVLRFKLDLDPAVGAYRQARALATGPTAASLILSADIGTILANMVTHPDLAAQTAAALIADQKAFDALPSPDRALILTLRARAELNRGDLDKALDYTVKALALSGDVHSTRVNLNQVTVRSDAGLISAIRHDETGMHEYFAYSGAGHLPSEDWLSGASTELPICNAEVTPEDTAVIEFSISEDGRTVGAAPVYASRPGQMGVIFARAVRTWRWRTEGVAKLDPFWRASIRMQLRCLTTPRAIELDEPFAVATRAWLRANGVRVSLGDASAAVGAAPVKAGGDLGRVSGLVAKVFSPNTGAGARIEAAAALDELLDKAGAPPEVRAFIIIASLGPNERSLNHAAAAGRARALGAAAPRFDVIPGGARSAAWLRTEQAIALEYSGDFPAARPPLEAVVALPIASLASEDPIRRVAILHLSLIDRFTGHEEAARARLTSAGMTGAQCSLLDVRPVPRKAGISSENFPEEALRWGFEGWLKEAFDIGPDGAVTDVRTVMAYPPFVFGPATEATLKHFRYMPPTLGDKVLGCAGETLSVHYVEPRSR